jgi:hypothetical protein
MLSDPSSTLKLLRSGHPLGVVHCMSDPSWPMSQIIPSSSFVLSYGFFPFEVNTVYRILTESFCLGSGDHPLEFGIDPGSLEGGGPRKVCLTFPSRFELGNRITSERPEDDFFARGLASMRQSPQLASESRVVANHSRMRRPPGSS